MKMDLKPLIPELKKWDGKLPKQALYQTEPRPDIYKIVRKCLGQALYQTEICFNEIAAKAKHKIPPAQTINRGRGQEVLYTRNMKKAI